MSEKDVHLEPEEGVHTAKDDDVEGHQQLNQQLNKTLGKDEDDVEGHVHNKTLGKDEDDDVEAHVNKNQPKA